MNFTFIKKIIINYYKKLIGSIWVELILIKLIIILWALLITNSKKNYLCLSFNKINCWSLITKLIKFIKIKIINN